MERPVPPVRADINVYHGAGKEPVAQSLRLVNGAGAKGYGVARVARMERTYSAKTLAVVSPMFEGAIRNGPLRSYAKS